MSKKSPVKLNNLRLRRYWQLIVDFLNLFEPKVVCIQKNIHKDQGHLLFFKFRTLICIIRFYLLLSI